MSNSVVVNSDLVPSSISLVKRKHGFKRGVRIKQIVDYIVSDLRQFPNLVVSNLEILSRACNLIENCIRKKDGIGKFEVLVDVYKILFVGISQVEFDLLKNQVQSLIDNKVIKKIPFSKRMIKYSLLFLSSFIVQNGQ